MCKWLQYKKFVFVIFLKRIAFVAMLSAVIVSNSCNAEGGSRMDTEL
jgi:hypothetical protein